MAQISAELEDEILERLMGGEDINNIILDVCNATDLDWRTVETFVRRSQVEKKDEIVVAQSPLLTLLALVICLTGVGLIVFSVDQLLLYYYSFSVPTVVHLAINLENIIGSLLLGLAMVIGSLKGMSAVWESIFEWFGKLSR